LEAPWPPMRRRGRLVSQSAISSELQRVTEIAPELTGPRLHLNAGYLTFSPSATVISHRHRLFKKLHSLLSSIRRIIQTRGHSCARTSRPSCRLGRGLTRSDRFYTPALIRPTSGSDGSCHSLWNLLAASRQRYWLPRKVHASSFMEFHAGYSRKVSAYTDLETVLLTLF
jgi:hypothetical protein